MSERLVVFPGILEPHHLGLYASADLTTDLLILTESADTVHAWRHIVGDDEARPRRALQSPIRDRDTRRSASHRRALELVLADPRTHFIIEREWGIGFGDRSTFNALPRLGAVCWNVLAAFERFDPDGVLLWSTPHLVEPWVASLIAESEGLPVIMSTDAPMPGSALLIEGVDRQQRLQARSGTIAGPVDSGHLAEAIDQFIATKRADYATGAPGGHRRALDRARSPAWNIRTEFDELRRALGGARDPRRAAARTAFFTKRSLGRRRLWEAYAELQHTPDYARPTLTVFLHYQPERTTLPEALAFGNQYEFVRALSSAVPDDWQIHVREHPATFVGPGPFHPGFRSPEFYHRLTTLPGVQLTTISGSPFAAIDNSQVIATGTGTVGLEAICRGTPVITAGNAQYRSMTGVLSLVDIRDDLETRIANFIGSARVDEDPAIANWLHSALRHAYAPSRSATGVDHRERRVLAHGSALRAIIDGGLASFEACPLQ